MCGFTILVAIRDDLHNNEPALRGMIHSAIFGFFTFHVLYGSSPLVRPFTAFGLLSTTILLCCIDISRAKNSLCFANSSTFTKK